MLITTGGVLIRIAVDGISSMGRSTIGVKLISIKESENECVATVAKVEKEEEEVEEEVEEVVVEGNEDVETTIEEKE
jgi:DNA gyrase subunit A